MASANDTNNNIVIKGVSVREDDDPETLITKRAIGTKSKKVVIYEKPWCNFSNSWIREKDIYEIKKGFILNHYAVLIRKYNILQPLTQCYLIKMGPLIDEFDVFDTLDEIYNVYFVFNIDDVHKQNILSLCMANNTRRQYDMSCLPTEIINKTVEDYLNKSSYNFECSYKGVVPEKISHAELEYLYENGIVNVGISYRANIIILSDESFDYIYPNGKNPLKELYDSKKRMQKHLKHIIKSVL